MNKLNLGRVKGDKGDPARVFVKSTTTLAPNEQATVYNAGTSQDVQLEFGIPEGIQGEQGPPIDLIAGDGIEADLSNPAKPVVSVKFGQMPNTVTEGDDQRLSNPRVPTGPAGGVLAGSYPNPDFAEPMATSADLAAGLGGKVDKVAGKGLSENDFTDGLKSKLEGIAAQATKNDTDANLKNRANHTGTQAINTVAGLQAALDGKPNTDTTYSAGNGLTLTGTTFSLPVTTTGSGTFVTSITQTDNGITANLGIPSNTTYTTGTLAQLQEGTDTAGRLQTAKNLSDWLSGFAIAPPAPVVVAANATVTLTNGRAVYAVNTTAAARTLTLPASPAAGARVTVLDYANTFHSNACTIARNGKNIEGGTASLTLKQKGQTLELVYVDATAGWKIISSDRYGGFGF